MTVHESMIYDVDIKRGSPQHVTNFTHVWDLLLGHHEYQCEGEPIMSSYRHLAEMMLPNKLFHDRGLNPGPLAQMVTTVPVSHLTKMLYTSQSVQLQLHTLSFCFDKTCIYHAEHKGKVRFSLFCSGAFVRISCN